MLVVRCIEWTACAKRAWKTTCLLDMGNQLPKQRDSPPLIPALLNLRLVLGAAAISVFKALSHVPVFEATFTLVPSLCFSTHFTCWHELCATREALSRTLENLFPAKRAYNLCERDPVGK